MKTEEVISGLAEALACKFAQPVTVTAAGLRIESRDQEGFAIELQFAGEEWTVYLGCGGWHEHFDDLADARQLIERCLSGGLRVREIYRGGVLQTSRLETETGGAWHLVSKTVYFAPFWRARTERILYSGGPMPTRDTSA